MGLRCHTLRVSNGSIINYCHIAWDEVLKDAVIIDPAWDFEAFVRHILIHELKPKAILLTHHHFDHINLADRLSTYYRIPAYISQVESIAYQYEIQNLTWVPNRGHIDIGSLEILAISTPGHTSGSTCYQISDSLYTGDTLFMEGCGICWGKGADPIDMYHSLQKLKDTIHSTTKIYPGHRYSYELGKSFDEVKRQNIYLKFENVEDFVRFRMRENQKGLFNFS